MAVRQYGRRRVRSGDRPLALLLFGLIGVVLALLLTQGGLADSFLGRDVGADGETGQREVAGSAVARASAPPVFFPPFSAREPAPAARMPDAPPTPAAAPPRAAPVPQSGGVLTPTPPPLSIKGYVDRNSSLVRHDPVLERQVLQAIDGAAATFGIAIKELSTGRGLLVNPEQEFYAASLFKLSLMYEVFNQRLLGKLGLGETLEITDRHVDFDLGTLDRVEGDAYSVGQALERMIVVSDNASAIMLQDRVGAWRANQSMQALGLQHTFVLADRLTTAPRDMLVFFETLARGKALDPTSSAAMVHLLLQQKINDRLPALLPRGAAVAHKTGNWADNVHDVGVIYGPNATIVMAVLTEDVEHAGRVSQAIARLARVVFDHFDQQSASPIPIPENPRLAYPYLEPRPTPTPEPESEAAPNPTAAPPTRTGATRSVATPTRQAPPTPMRAATRTP